MGTVGRGVGTRVPTPGNPRLMLEVKKSPLVFNSVRAHACDMRISDKALDELIAIYRDEFGEEIDRTQATDMAHRLLPIVGHLARKPKNAMPMTNAGAMPQG